MKETSIKKNIVFSTFYQVLLIIIPFVTIPYISRVIGSSGVGIYSYTNSIQTYFSMFAALGTISYGSREIARNRDNLYNRSKLFWEIECLTIITSFFCIIIWGFVIGFSRDYRIYFLILALNLFNTMFDISWFYAGMEAFKYTIIQNSIFKILGVILLFMFVKTSNDLALYMIITCVTTLLGTMSMWIYLPKFIQKIKIRNLKIRRHFKETLVYFVPTIATSIYTVLDKTLIGTITNNEDENGYYEQATNVINMTKALTFTSLNAVLGARISYLFSEKRYGEIRRKIDISINYILFMGFGILFGLLAVSDLFVPVFFGQGYEKVSTLIKVLSPLVIIIGISNCLGSQYYNPAGLRAKSAKFIIFGSIVNFILNLILIPKFWAYGACIATIIAELVISSLYLINCDSYLTLKRICKYSWKKIIAGLLMYALTLAITLIKANVIIIVAAQISFGVLAYVIVLFVLRDEFVIGAYNNQIRPMIRKIFKRFCNND